MQTSLEEYCYDGRFSTGEVLKNMREERALSQEQVIHQLAVRFNKKCTQKRFSRYENGTCKQPILFLIHCCAVYGIHPITFLICIMTDDLKKRKFVLDSNPGQFLAGFVDELYDRSPHIADRFSRIDQSTFFDQFVKIFDELDAPSHVKSAAPSEAALVDY